MAIVTEDKLRRRGLDVDTDAIEATRRQTEARIDAQSSPLYATARLWDDGIIDPRDTRKVLAMSLAVSREGDARRPRPNTFGVARM
jgi:geranyl-CoA carboxylase beta subunit